MPNAVNLVFPHQLFKNSELFNNDAPFCLIEEFLFFQQYKFHQQKIAFHRASMKAYQHYLTEQGKEVFYIKATDSNSDIRNFQNWLAQHRIETIYVIDPTDDWLTQRINALQNVEIQTHDSPLFLNTPQDLSSFFKPSKKSFFQTTFYKQQRKQRNLLMDGKDQPVGRKWTFDTENRKKYPKSKTPPAVHFPEKCEYWNEAVEYTHQHFSNHYGSVSEHRWYPINFEESEAWLQQFLNYRFHDFGAYEDAIVQSESILNHSLISPLINVGLLAPQYVLDESINYAKQNDVPINSTEGFVRQIIGWREFIRGMYECKGRMSRTKNYWGFTRKIPSSFYDGSTGILPIDETIKKVLKSGYCHHIERLMVLGNFMLLCEFDPDEVYQWFMELFIDAYDWVMVPNVYGMCQFADGGTFATKPYIGGSNYIKKMSNYPKGDWETTWDGLFWRFMHVHQDFFKSNPRTGMLLNTWNKMSDDKKQGHLKAAEEFLGKLVN